MPAMDSPETPGQPLALERILDANLDRAREGLRVIEEWFRFGLDRGPLAEECKQMRQEIARWHDPALRLARDTPGDVGRDLSHPQEERRSSFEHLLQANFCRVEEALRVLEEYGKLYRPEMGAAFKHLRYRAYVLESRWLARRRHQQLEQAPLYLVTSPSEQLLATVEAALKGGLTLVQYRDKEASDRLRLERGRQLRQLCHDYGALFILNDRADLALAVGADGVHLGQEDIPIALARQILGPQRIVGRSTTNPQEMERAIAEGADYIGVGPVYETPTKAGKPAAGLDYVRHAARHAPLPWFAIGGIDLDNLEAVRQAGATRVAAVRAIVQASDPTAVARAFLSRLA